MKKITALMSAIALFLTALLVASPAAQAATVQQSFSCTYDNSSISKVSGLMRLTSTDEGRINVYVTFDDAEDNRIFYTTLTHNSDFTAKVESRGNTTFTRTIVDTAGPDGVKGVIVNRAETLRCVSGPIYL